MKAKKTFNVRLKVLLTNYLLPRPQRIIPRGRHPFAGPQYAMTFPDQ
jgi:hypothetical protein